MAISRAEAKQLLERLIFEESNAQEWVQDVWEFSPTLGDDAAKLIEVYDALIESCSEEKLENLLQGLYQRFM
ncbi:hypothetical protein H6G89_10640 [Oscillatoria sp. FACHB-1407]|uniref:hypothetical protein n=1 Tax=Oscillatoria sp. FACHB-1407 TaxID=2692847 RepID=UPI001683616D|nr:hypothetical protein [Oscillatoria sp. FACHB-1407]MBD2461506.1 hypothetical protein [Oscillatoria sp. FACHB-1407]